MPFDTTDTDLKVIPVASKAELRRFIDLANRLERRRPQLGRAADVRADGGPDARRPTRSSSTPTCSCWLAVRDGRDVGRISAQIDHLATEDRRRARPAGSA